MNQTLENVEIILVTKISVDNFNLSHVSSKVRIILADMAKDKSELIEIGVREASSDIILFLDDDDIITKDKAELIVSLFKRNQTLGLIHNGQITIGEDTKRYSYIINDLPRRNARLILTDSLKDAVRNDCDRNLSSISIRKSAVMKFLNNFPLFNSSDDSLVLYSVFASGYEIGWVSDKLTFYRIHHGGRTSISGNFTEYKFKGKRQLIENIKPHSLFLEIFQNKEIMDLQVLRKSYYIFLYSAFAQRKENINSLPRVKYAISYFKWVHISGNHPPHIIGYLLGVVLLMSKRAYLSFSYLLSIYRLRRQ